MLICKRPLILLASPVLLSLVCIGCGDGWERTEQLQFDDPIQHIEVNTGSGEIFVVAEADRERIEVEAVIRGYSTRLRWELDGETLRLTHRCPPGAVVCTVDWYVWVPQQSAEYLNFDLESGSGDIAVEHTFGNIRAATGSGDLWLDDTVGFTVELEAGSGDMQLLGCEADSIATITGSGDVEATLRGDPRHVALQTGSGDVRLTVPGDGYQLDLDTGSGDVDVDGLTHDPDGDSRISISTGSGDVAVIGKAG